MNNAWMDRQLDKQVDRQTLLAASDVKRFQPIMGELACSWEPIGRTEAAQNFL